MSEHRRTGAASLIPDTMLAVARIPGVQAAPIVVEGTNQADTLNGNHRDNRIFGFSGNDRLDGRGGDDVLNGGRGADRLTGGTGLDTASYLGSDRGITANLADPGENTGEAKGDTYTSIEALEGTRHDDTLQGDGSTNTLLGDTGADTLEGRGGADLLYGEGGDDELFGGDGNDLINGDAGADLLDGGDGVDRLSYSEARSGVTADLGDPDNNRGDADGDVYVSLENLAGSRLGDKLFGDNAANVVWGLNGDDQLSGRGGDDVLDGGAGSDRLNGGSGDDRVSYELASRGLTLNLLDSSKSTGDARGDRFISIEGFRASTFDDRLVGTHTGDGLAGGLGNDRIVGNGDDFVFGGNGLDRMTGGSGADDFVFNAGLIPANLDVITDFKPGQDTVQLSATFFDALPAGAVSSNAFVVGNAATTAQQHLIYNDNTGALLYDDDGAGGAAAVRFATLDKDLAMTAGDFFVF